MARVSRKKKDSSTIQIPEIIQNKCASYSRLSVKDKNKSNSIETQKMMIRNYIARHSDMTLISEYSDNGKSGTNFNRNDFQRMLEDVKRNRINCIVVKDFSRFGRDYIDVLEMLEKIFPTLGVRFISIEDDYDSFDQDCDKARLTNMLKHIANEFYAKEVSKKLIQAHELSRSKGEFWGAKPPYGFKRAANNSKKLLIDEEAAGNVRMIFNWYVLDGLSYHEIVRKLNCCDILSPYRYYYYINGIESEDSEQFLWSQSAVANLITNPIYIGHLVYEKTKQSFYQNIPRKKQNQSERMILENALPCIVEKSLYEKAQNISTRRAEISRQLWKSKAPKEPALFKGSIYCGKCGRHLRRRRYTVNGERRYNYYCDTPGIDKRRCSAGNISEKYIVQSVTEVIFKWIQFSAEYQKKSRDNHLEEALKSEYNIENNRLEQKISELNLKTKHLYEDYVQQLLTSKEYQEIKKIYKEQRDLLCIEKKELSERKEKVLQKVRERKLCIELLSGYKEEKILTLDMVQNLIERVIVYDKNTIETVFRFKDIFYGDIRLILEGGSEK